MNVFLYACLYKLSLWHKYIECCPISVYLLLDNVQVIILNVFINIVYLTGSFDICNFTVYTSDIPITKYSVL